MSRETQHSTNPKANTTVGDFVSVVIVSWNHLQFLPQCLHFLSNQTYPLFDITVVDNASQDGSPAWIASNYPHLRLVCLELNMGFSYGFNLGARKSKGEFVLSLNPDVNVRPDFLSKMVSEAKKDARIGIVAPKLLRGDDPIRLDSTGLFINRQRRPYDRGQMEPDNGQYDTCTEIFGACGAAALLRRAMLNDLTWEGEFFDEDFFAFYEDADLAWRARLMGWRSVYAPGAVAEHVRSWADKLRGKNHPKNRLGPRYALRNRYLMMIKNDTLVNFLIDFPWIILPDIPRLLYVALFRPALLKAIVDFIRLRPRAYQKRHDIQNRSVTDSRRIRRWFR